MDAEKFVIPEAGAWELEQTHAHRPLTRWMQQVFPKNMMAGFKDATARYGALLSHLEVAIINGFIYTCPRPVGAPKAAKGPPPKLIFKVLTKLHPEIRRRIKRSAVVFATKAWREDVIKWDTASKPRILARNAELYAVDPSKLDNSALIRHLVDVEERMADALFHHHSLNLCALVPPGDFLVHMTEWTVIKSSELCGLLSGTSQVSVGATDELSRAVGAIRADADATRILAGTGPSGDIVTALRAHAGEVGAAMRAYIDIVGLRTPGGYDISELSTIEMPDIIVGALRKGPTTKLDPATIAAETTRIRELVPQQHRAEFDELLAEARLVYRIRDERGYLNDAFASGLVRRAVLAAGDKLVAAGKLEAREQGVDFTPAELRAALAGEPGPSAAEIAAHAKFRMSHTVEDAPPALGLPKSAPPPADWLPPPAARMMRAINAALGAMFEVPPKAPEPKMLRGLAASPGTYEGRARVVLGAEQFSKVEHGDILIARTTCPSYNVLLPLLGGIVTDRGGLLSHAAIVAREYGMPAVVGTTDATSFVPDGARVRVDGGTGEVVVLS